MDLEKLEPNSHKYNEIKAQEKVTKGKVTIKKKPISSRFASLFLSEDIGNVKEYIFFDILIPAIRDGIVSIIQNGTEMLFYGRSGSRKSKGETYVSYSSYSKDRGEPLKKRSKPMFSYDDILLETRQDAIDTVKELRDHLKRYDRVTLSELYQIIGVSGVGYTDNYFGWTDLDDVRIIKCREGYLLKLPECEQLE